MNPVRSMPSFISDLIITCFAVFSRVSRLTCAHVAVIVVACALSIVFAWVWIAWRFKTFFFLNEFKIVTKTQKDQKKIILLGGGGGPLMPQREKKCKCLKIKPSKMPFQKLVPWSQTSPSYPVTHAHVYPPAPSSVHVPPFWHGCERMHGSSRKCFVNNIKKGNCEILNHCFANNWKFLIFYFKTNTRKNKSKVTNLFHNSRPCIHWRKCTHDCPNYRWCMCQRFYTAQDSSRTATLWCLWKKGLFFSI